MCDSSGRSRAESKGIIHFSTSDSGGAGSGAYRLHRLSIDAGFESIMFVQRKSTEDATVVEVGERPQITFFQRVIRKIRYIVERKRRKYCFFDKMSYTLKDVDDVIKQLPFLPGVVFVHWVSGFLDTDVVLSLHKRFGSKVYSTFMDVAPITGGCHYPWDCTGYTRNCSKCPAVPFFEKSLPMRNLQKKIDLAQQVAATPVTSISWLRSKIQQSSVFRNSDFGALHIGIDSDVFSPGSKRIAREKLGLDPAKKLVLVAASSLKDGRKGISHARLAIQQLANRHPDLVDNTQILLAGLVSDPHVTRKWVFPVITTGFVSGDEALADLYISADVFLSTSVEDAGPMMIGESMMCGTPVISFEMGVAPDLISNGESGYVVPLRNADALSEALAKLLLMNNDEYQRVASNARATALKKISWRSQKRALKQLVESYLD